MGERKEKGKCDWGVVCFVVDKEMFRSLNCPNFWYYASNEGVRKSMSGRMLG
jgi:hypothetical protein